MNIEELKRLAAPLVKWGADSAWENPSCTAAVGYIDEDGNRDPILTVDTTIYDGFEGDSLELANFYAAANPAAVLELIAEVDRLRDEVNGLTGELCREQKRLDWAVSREAFYDHVSQVFFCDRAFKITNPQVRINTDDFRATIDNLMDMT